MSRVQALENELEKLSAEEMRTIRDWLDVKLQDSSSFGELRDEIAAGVQQLQAGKVSPYDEAAVARIKAKGRKLASEK